MLTIALQTTESSNRQKFQRNSQNFPRANPIDSSSIALSTSDKPISDLPFAVLTDPTEDNGTTYQIQPGGEVKSPSASPVFIVPLFSMIRTLHSNWADVLCSTVRGTTNNSPV